MRIVYPPDLPELAEQLERIQRGELQLHNLVYRLVNRNGELVWISCRGKSSLSTEGVPMWMIGRISDTIFKGKLDQLTSDQDSLEKYAREQFYFHREDEEVFIVD